MRIGVCAMGRMKSGPERELADDYIARANAAGRALGIGPMSERELDPRKFPGRAAETDALLAAIPGGARLCVLDERGESLSSPDLAARLAAWRDSGARDAVFLIGGAEGMAPPARARADLVLAFGPAVWPHRLVRIMLYEQLYRALTILGGAAYHKE